MQELRPVADELGLSLAQLAVAWVLQNDNVAAAIIGASRPEQVTENVKASGVDDPGRAAGADRRGPRRLRGLRPGRDREERTARALSDGPAPATGPGSAHTVTSSSVGDRDRQARQEQVHERADGQRVGERREADRAAQQPADGHHRHLDGGADQPHRAPGPARRARS